MNDKLQELIDQGIITPSQTKYGVSCFLFPIENEEEVYAQGGIKMEKITFKLKPRDRNRKMDAEEVQEHLKVKRGNGAHKSKKDYTRKPKHKDVI